MIAGPSWRQAGVLAVGTQARLPAEMTVRSLRLRPVPDSMLMAGWLIAVIAIIVIGAAAAATWPTAIAAFAFRAGHVAGVAWAALRNTGAWLLDGLRRIQN